MDFPANDPPQLKGSPFYDTLYRDIEITLPADTGTDPYHIIPKSLLDQDKGRRDHTYRYSYTTETIHVESRFEVWKN